MSVFDEALSLIERGRLGLNEGLSIGLPRLSQYVPGVQQGVIYLIGGVTGSGKSALASDIFLDNPYLDFLTKTGINLKIIVYSLETSRETFIIKNIAKRLYRDHNYYVDVPYILSRGKNRVSDSIYRLVIGYRKLYEQFEDIVDIHGPDNPTGIRNTVLRYLTSVGRDTYKEPIEVVNDGVKSIIRPYDKYVPNNPNTYVILIVDHVNILKTERSYNKKQNIDKLCEYMVEMSNRYKISPVLVQQINRGVENIDRHKASSIDIMLSDFKETGDTTDAAHVVFALNYPHRWDIEMYRKYKSRILGDFGRFITILKNRDGEANKYVGLHFMGGIGKFTELPRVEDMSDQIYTNLTNIRKSYNV